MRFKKEKKKTPKKPTGINEDCDNKITRKKPDFMPSNHCPVSLTFLPQR